MKMLGTVWRTKDIKKISWLFTKYICFAHLFKNQNRSLGKATGEYLFFSRDGTVPKKRYVKVAEISTRVILTAEPDRQEKPVFVYLCRFLTRDVKSVCPFVCPSLPPSLPKLSFHRRAFIQLTILSRVSVRMSRYWARGKFGEHKRCVTECSRRSREQL